MGDIWEMLFSTFQINIWIHCEISGTLLHAVTRLNGMYFQWMWIFFSFSVSHTFEWCDHNKWLYKVYPGIGAPLNTSHSLLFFCPFCFCSYCLLIILLRMQCILYTHMVLNHNWVEFTYIIIVNLQWRSGHWQEETIQIMVIV